MRSGKKRRSETPDSSTNIGMSAAAMAQLYPAGTDPRVVQKEYEAFQADTKRVERNRKKRAAAKKLREKRLKDTDLWTNTKAELMSLAKYHNSLSCVKSMSKKTKVQIAERIKKIGDADGITFS